MNADSPNTELLPPSPFAKSDIVRRFLAWAQSADAEARAEGASALARSYLYSGLAAPERAEATLAMTALLDDPSVLVRRALAEALCRSSESPRTLILGLAVDEPEVAAPVLQHSPVLTEADLLHCVVSGDGVARMALARRPRLPTGVIAALVETGQVDVVLALIGNLEVGLSPELLGQVLTGFDQDTNVREALLQRPSPPASVRVRIALAAAKDLAAEASQWMAADRAERLAREARDQAICSIASSCRRDERAELTHALRRAGALTPAVLLRSLLGGERDLFVAAIAELSDLPPPRVAAFMVEPRGEGFAALACRAGLKNGLLPVFRAALAAIKANGEGIGGRLRLSLVQTVIDECERLDNPALAKVLALLWRFAAEAARAEAAGFAREAAASSSGGRLPPILDFSPVNDDAGHAPMLTGPAPLNLSAPLDNAA